jgi:hypothetical protein
MRLFSDATGVLMRELWDDFDESVFGAPAGYTYELEIDPLTNQEIIGYIQTDFNNTRLVAGEVFNRGVPIAVNPPGQEWIERLRQEQAASDASAIPAWANYTIAEALAWHDANIRNPIIAAPTVTAGNAVAVLQAMVDMLKQLETENRAIIQMLIALRNKTWPGLEGG